jgi:hypothetical protein
MAGGHERFFAARGALRVQIGRWKVFNRDHWFYLEEHDVQSRVAFALLHTLFFLQTATGNGRQPLLTIPGAYLQNPVFLSVHHGPRHVLNSTTNV